MSLIRSTEEGFVVNYDFPVIEDGEIIVVPYSSLPFKTIREAELFSGEAEQLLSDIHNIFRRKDDWS